MKLARNVADIGMSKGVIPDLVPFAIDALGHVGEFIGLDSDQEKGGRRLFLLEHIQNLGRPLRVGPVIKGDRNFVRARSPYRPPDRLGQRIEAFDR